MARIGIDATSVSTHGKGVSRYQRNIVQSLSRLESNHEYYVFLNEAYRISPFVQEPNWHFVSVKIWKEILWEQIEIPRWIRRLALDLFHVTTDRIPYFSKGPFLLQLFEVPDHRVRFVQKAPSRYSLYKRMAEVSRLVFFPSSVGRAARILVSSKNTQKELTDKYHMDPQKMRVVPLSHETTFRPETDSRTVSETRKNLGAPAGYILHFSTQDPRENTEAVLAAFEKAKNQIERNIKLLIIGIEEKKKRKDVIYKGYLDERELVRIYQAALAYVDPSFYEGFALQILEAIACGVPVVASRRSSIPELVGDAGILIDPEDAEAIAHAMTRILMDDNLWREIRQKGLERAKLFSWEKTARQTLSAYEEILNER